MKDCSPTSHYGCSPWNNTNLSAYSPFADKFEFETGLKDPSLCPRAHLVDVINSVKDPVAFYNALTAEQQKQFVHDVEALGPKKCPEELLTTVISEAQNPTAFFNSLNPERDRKDVFKELSEEIQLNIFENTLATDCVNIFNYLPLEQKTAIFPNLHSDLKCLIFEQWHAYREPLIGSGYWTTDVNAESIALFKSIDHSTQNSLLNSFESSQMRAMTQNLEVFQSLSVSAQKNVIIQHIKYDRDPSNLSFYQTSSFAVISKTTADLFGKMSLPYQLAAFLELKGVEEQAELIKLLPKSSQIHICGKSISSGHLFSIYETLDAKSGASLANGILDTLPESDLMNTHLRLFASTPDQTSLERQKAKYFFNALLLENQSKLFKVSTEKVRQSTQSTNQASSLHIQSYLRLPIKKVLQLAGGIDSEQEHEVVLAQLTGKDRSTYFYAINNKSIQTSIYSNLNHAQRAELALNIDMISEINKGAAMNVICDNISILQSNKDKTRVFLSLREDQQKEIFQRLVHEGKLQTLDLSFEKIIDLSKSFTTKAKASVIFLFNNIQDQRTYFASLTDDERKEIFKHLDQYQQNRLSMNVFGSTSSLAKQYAMGETPFSIEGANQFLNRVSTSPAKKTLEYDFFLNRESKQIKAFNEENGCSLQDIANQVCSVTRLNLLHVHCSEKVEHGYISSSTPLVQFEKGEPSDCTITLTGKEGVRQESFVFPADAEKYQQFARGMPSLHPNHSFSKAYQELSILRESAKEPGVSLSAKLTASTGMTKEGYALFDPVQKFQGYFSKNKIDQKADGKTLTTECSEDVNKDGLNSACQFKVLDTVTGFFQRLTHIVEKSGETVLGASNPATIQNWENAFKKIGITYANSSENILTIAGAPEPEPTENPSSASWFGNFGSFSSTKRTSDLALFNILPSIAGGVIAYQCGKFIENAIKNPKKTNGQKTAAVMIGGAGILAGIALGYKRLSQINVGL